MELFALFTGAGCLMLGYYCRTYHVASAKVLIDFKEKQIAPYFDRKQAEREQTQGIRGIQLMPDRAAGQARQLTPKKHDTRTSVKAK